MKSLRACFIAVTLTCVPVAKALPAETKFKIARICDSYLGAHQKSEYVTYAMSPIYILVDLHLVPYLTEEERQARRIEVDAQGEWYFASSGLRVGPGKYIFVMDGFGSILIERDEYGLFRPRHSSLEGRVASAGVAHFDDSGHMRKVTNNSGHFYRRFPRHTMLDQFQTELEKRGLDLRTIQFREYAE